MGAAILPLVATPSFGTDFLGLSTDGNRLLRFDTTGAVSLDVPISGLPAGDSLVDIDAFFSGDRRLYGLGESGTLYRIDPTTGAASVNVPNATLGSPTAIDFNPAADRLRVFSDDSNFRITPNSGVVTSDGTLAYAAADIHAGANPNLRAAAYINNVDAPGSTALYSIDSDLDTLNLHSGGPQFSVLNTVADLTLNGGIFDISDQVGFDVFSPADGMNFAFLSNGNDLYQINLANGQLTALASVASSVTLRSIAVAVPEASTIWAGAAFATLAAGWIVRQRRSQNLVGATHP
ncbi:MAG: DUF4394 domain-containing protein [Limisphaerales bacterium]